MNSINSTTTTPAAATHTLTGEDVWLRWREDMPVTAKWAYFDHAAVAPLPGETASAIARFAAEASTEGDTVWPTWAAKLETLRGQFAELCGAEAGELTLVPNTTAGINLVAEGFDWRAGDSLIVPEGEFPSNLYPWLNQQHRGVEVRIVPRREHGVVEVDDLLERADASTRIIAVSWVGYSSGFRIDLQRLVERAHERGILVFLDAIQGLGIYPLDVAQTPVDFLAADGHKWMLGPEGAGVAMVRREHLDRLRCPSVGWNSVRDAHLFSGSRFELKHEAARFEGGSYNMMGMIGLSASLEKFLDAGRRLGRQAIGERVLDAAEDLDRRVRRVGATTRIPAKRCHRSGIVTIDIPRADPAEVRRRALDSGIVVSCRGGGLRASLHVYNTDEERQRLADVIGESIAAAG